MSNYQEKAMRTCYLVAWIRPSSGHVEKLQKASEYQLSGCLGRDELVQALIHEVRAETYDLASSAMDRYMDLMQNVRALYNSLKSCND